jgi:Fe2+ or Zn2+ uptake regulation protein
MPVLLNQRVIQVLQQLRGSITFEELSHRLNAGSDAALASLRHDVAVLEQHDLVLRDANGQLRVHPGGRL